MNVKTAFGATGDGVTDDTAAIQAAISSGLGMGSDSLPHKTLFFPKGTYLISRPLVWKLANGSWSTAVTLQGENRDQTIIKLKNGAPGFADAASPRAVILTASKNLGNQSGSGNQAFQNFIFDLTVDVGANNPGAVGIDYLANNRGAIRNVVVRASTGSGTTGIAMTRPWPGPCLLTDVRVVGFNVGIRVTQPEYSITMENIDLRGQHTYGLSNTDNVVSIHRMTSTNKVPAVMNSSRRGLVTLVGAKLVGGSAANAAVVNAGKLYLRGVTTGGYAKALSDRGVSVTGPAIGEYTTGRASGLFTPIPQRSLNLPIANPPTIDPGPPSRWTSVAAYGAKPVGPDNSAAIQAALNSGHPIIYFPPGQYNIRHTLTVGPAVREILGFNSTLYATEGDFATSNQSHPLMRFTGGAKAATVVRQLFLFSTPGVTNIVDSSAGTVFLQDVQLLNTSGGYTNRPGVGPLFLEDVQGGPWNFANPQQVWARQLNPENVSGPKIWNNGGKVWVFGLKTEQPTTILRSTHGASSELLGGFVYSVEVVPASTPAFVTVNSQASLSYLAQGKQYAIQVEETRGAVTRRFPVPRPGFDTLMPLFSG